MKAGQGKNRGLKIVTCVCFLLITAALLLIDRYSPATGYELSIYESLPAAVWICLILAIAGGTGLIVHEAFGGRQSRYWLLAFAVLVLGILAILLVHTFRGYYLYAGGDTRAHLQWTEHVLVEGHFWQGNRYPITHILVAQLAQILNASPGVVAKYPPVFFTALFMLFSYLLATTVMPTKGHALLAAGGTTALFFNYYHVCIYPQTLSIMSFPLLFYLYFKGFGEASLPFRVAFVIVLLLFPYFHPAPAGVLIACLLAAELAKAMWRARQVRAPTSSKGEVDRLTLGPTLICSVAFLTWVSSYAIFASTVQKVLGWLTDEIESIPHVVEVEHLVTSQALGPQQQVEIAVKMYGDNLIYLSLSAVALIGIVWRFVRRDNEAKRLSILSMPFLVSGPVWVLIFFSTLRVTVGRLLGANIMMWATPVLAAFALYELFGRWKRAGVMVVTSILLCACVIGVFGVYHSPYILQASWQITRHDVQGAQWFRDNARPVHQGYLATLGIPYGFVERSHLRVPDHFGRPRHQAVGELFPEAAYVLLAERFKSGSAHPILSKTTLSPSDLIRPGFSQADLERLEQDSSVSKLYSNGGLDVLLTTPQ